MTMITFGEKLRYLRRKNNLTQKELGMAVGFPENTADVRIAQYETNARMPREELLKSWHRYLEYRKKFSLFRCSQNQKNSLQHSSG